MFSLAENSENVNVLHYMCLSHSIFRNAFTSNMWPSHWWHLTTTSDLSIDTRLNHMDVWFTCMQSAELFQMSGIYGVQTGFWCLCRPHNVLLFERLTKWFIYLKLYPGRFWGHFMTFSILSQKCPLTLPRRDHPARRRQCTSGPGDHQSLSFSIRDLKTSWLMWTLFQNKATDLERVASLFLKHTERPMLVTAEEESSRQPHKFIHFLKAVTFW